MNPNDLGRVCKFQTASWYHVELHDATTRLHSVNGIYWVSIETTFLFKQNYYIIYIFWHK